MDPALESGNRPKIDSVDPALVPKIRWVDPALDTKICSMDPALDNKSLFGGPLDLEWTRRLKQKPNIFFSMDPALSRERLRAGSIEGLLFSGQEGRFRNRPP